jgi:hypothetical protein
VYQHLESYSDIANDMNTLSNTDTVLNKDTTLHFYLQLRNKYADKVLSES